MSIYPYIILYRFDKYKEIDEEVLKINKKVTITSNVEELKKLFDPSNQIMVTYGDTESEYYPTINSVIVDRFRKQWIHFSNLDSIKNNFYNYTNYCFVNNSIKRTPAEPKFSLFTPCYNIWNKIDRVYKSLIENTMKDWEWVLLDDSTDEGHFKFLQEKFGNDLRIRLYCRGKNSGNIGNVKNEAVGLCRGKYVLELDHDDEITPWCLDELVKCFESDEDIGFIYTDFINVCENYANYYYGNMVNICAGYGGYYIRRYNNRWVYIYITPSINNVTLRYGLPCLPNHCRVWRRDYLLSLGNYCPYLPIADDLEILLKTAMGKKKIVKLNTLGYIQYMNDGGNNTSIKRLDEIIRISNQFIVPQFFNEYDILQHCKDLSAYEIETGNLIWKEERENKFMNEKRSDSGIETQYLFLILDIAKMKEICSNDKNDVIFLTYQYDNNTLSYIFDTENILKIKFFSLKGSTENVEDLKRFFFKLYRTSNTKCVVIDTEDEVPSPVPLEVQVTDVPPLPVEVPVTDVSQVEVPLVDINQVPVEVQVTDVPSLPVEVQVTDVPSLPVEVPLVDVSSTEVTDVSPVDVSPRSIQEEDRESTSESSGWSDTDEEEEEEEGEKVVIKYLLN